MYDPAQIKQQHVEEAARHGVGHIVSPKILILNTAALLVLTVVTVLVAKVDFMAFNIYELNILVALAVAVLKASLVCLFFMHLYWDRPFNGFVLVSSIAFVALFMALAIMDTFSYAPDVIMEDPSKVREILATHEES